MSPDAHKRAALRLWAALSAPARAALDGGAILGSRSLSPAAHAAMWRHLLSATTDGGGNGPGFLDRRGGLPPLELSWRLHRSDSTLTLVADGSAAGAVIDPEFLAAILYRQGRGEWLEPATGFPDARAARFRPGGRLTRSFWTAFGPGRFEKHGGSLIELHFEPGPGVGWESLPAPLLTPIRENLEWMKTQRGVGGTN